MYEHFTEKNSLSKQHSASSFIISEYKTISYALFQEKLTKQCADAKSKIKNLQEDLATSEIVQKEFVQLSQTLQVNRQKLSLKMISKQKYSTDHPGTIATRRCRGALAGRR